MKSKFLVSTAAFAVSIALYPYPVKADTIQTSTQTPRLQGNILHLAQEKGGGGMGGGMSSPGGTSKGETTEPKKGGSEKGMQEKGMHKGGMEKGASEKGGMEKKGMEKGEKAEPRDKHEMKSEKNKDEKSTEKREGKDREKMTRDRDEGARASEKSSKEKSSERATTTEKSGGGKSVQLNSSQQTRIKTVIKSEHITRISRSDVHFSINVGTRVPPAVHLVTVPPTIVEIVPEYRGYYYVVVEDDLLIIDPDTREIVAVILLT